MDANLHHGTKMRNRNISARVPTLGFSGFATSVAMLLLATGCAPKSKSAQRNDPAPLAPEQRQAVLDAGFAALESQQYNEAAAKADELLAGGTHRPGSAE